MNTAFICASETMQIPRILILDCEKLIRWSLGRILAQDGYAVDTAATNVEALDLAGQAEYAMIITDIEVCGDQIQSFLAAIAAKQPAACVVALTAMPRDEAEKTLGDAATFEVIEKPFASDMIRAVVKAAIGQMNRTPNKQIKGRNSP